MTAESDRTCAKMAADRDERREQPERRNGEHAAQDPADQTRPFRNADADDHHQHHTERREGDERLRHTGEKRDDRREREQVVDAERQTRPGIHDAEVAPGEHARRDPGERQSADEEHDRVREAVADALQRIEQAAGRRARGLRRDLEHLLGRTDH